MLSSNTGGDDANKNSSSGAVVGDAIGVGVEGMSGVVDVTGEVDSGAGHDLAQEEVHVVQKQQSATIAREKGRDLDGRKR